MEKIISILKKLNKKTSNWTSRIKTADDYFNFQEKYLAMKNILKLYLYWSLIT